MSESHSSERQCVDAGRRVLARNPVVTVEACRCGVVHLHFGPMSLRFTAPSIEQLYRTLGEVQAKLAAEGAGVDPLVATGAPRGLA